MAGWRFKDSNGVKVLNLSNQWALLILVHDIDSFSHSFLGFCLLGSGWDSDFS
jgi:hypothetical protein